MRAFGFDRQSFQMMARALGVTGVAAAAFLMTPSPAQALPFPPSPRDIHNRVVHDVRHALEVPRAIHQAHVDAIHSVVHGTSGYAPRPYYHAAYHAGYRAAYHAAYRPAPRYVVSVGPGPYYYAPVLYPPPPPPLYVGRGCDRPYYGR